MRAKGLLVLIAVVAAVLASPFSVWGQETSHIDAYIEVLRSDIRARKVAAITEVMQFTDKESTAFWPVYRKYELDANELNDERIALIRDFADNYHIMTDEKAEELIEQVFKWEEKRTELKKRYFGEFKKILATIRAARLIQVENTFNLLIDLQITSQVPLVE